ncbi:MAG: glycosyl transferase, partial [Desulfonatronovibrio sp.]
KDQGGTAMVANLLNQGLQAHGADSTVQSEVVSSQGNDPFFKEFVPEKDVFYHIHSTRDWVATLKSLKNAGVAPVITMHDASILTGGCVYPLEC